jgi:hypothetical protein
MIGFNGLGRHGRLGNQMFQYAALRGIAAKHNYDWCIPPSNFRQPYYDHQLFELFNLKSLKYIGYVPDNYPLIVETDFYFDSGLFSNCPDNINLGGFFQTEKYFKHIKNSIKEDFTFKDNIINPCKKIINKFEDCLSLHIRRNDYINIKEFLGIDYYTKALSYFNNKKVIVFSDDTKWCEKQELFQSNRFFISPFNNAIDLCLMTLCSGHIISNSSFSWWGAWLSNSSTIISPNKWFGNNSIKDIIPKDWIVI